MARRRAPRNRGLHVDVEGLDELIGMLEKGAKELPSVYRAVLEGEGGEAIAAETRQRGVRWSRSLAATVRVRKPSAGSMLEAGLRGIGKAGAVEIGPAGNHPKSGMPMQNVGTWGESGTKPHDIGTGARTNTSSGHRRRTGLHLSGGTWVAGPVKHPGIKPRRIMSGALRAVRWEVEAAITDELTRRAWLKEGA